MAGVRELLDQFGAEVDSGSQFASDLEFLLLKAEEAFELLDAIRLAMAGGATAIAKEKVIAAILEDAVLTTIDLEGTSSVARLLVAIRKVDGRLEVSS